MNRVDLLKLGLKVRKFVVHKIVPVSWEINPITLECGCAIASYTLMKALRKLNQTATLVEWSDDFGHCWVEHRGLVVDTTATQFDDKLPKVYIVKKSKYNVINLRDGKISRGLRAEKELTRWSDSQSPFTFKRQIDNFLKEI